MGDLSLPARDSVAAQRELFRRAKLEEGLTPATISKANGKLPKSTLEGWASGATAMPAWALGALGEAGIPDYLLSLVLEPFQRHVSTDEDGEGDFDTAASEAIEFAAEHAKARHPKSPGGVAIVHTEAQVLSIKGRRACGAMRRAAKLTPRSAA